MPTFEPPAERRGRTTDADPRLVKKNPLGNKLMAHFAGAPVGVNVYLLVDGSTTEVQPELGDTDSSVARVFHGGHVHTVSEFEATLLTLNGYTVED